MSKLPLPEATISDIEMLPWESQRIQFSPYGFEGLEYHKELLIMAECAAMIDVLLLRGTQGKLQGILYRYPQDVPPYEKAGNINVYVAPEARRTGVASRLLDEATSKWSIDFDQQRYSPSGLALVEAWWERNHKEE